jgi:hypothetical protein
MTSHFHVLRLLLLILLINCLNIATGVAKAPPDTEHSIKENPAPNTRVALAPLVRPTESATITTSSTPPVSADSDRRDPPPNDLCEQAELVTGPFPVEISGSIEEATVDCPELLGWNAVWYAIELPYASQHVTIDWCDTPEFPEITSYGVVYMDDCACDNYVAGIYNWNCNNDNMVLQWLGASGPDTILFPLYMEGATDYTISIDVEEYFPIPGNYCSTPFVVEGLPYQFSGTTSDNTHTYGNHYSPDEWHRFYLETTEQVTISLCGGGTDYDSFLYLLAYDCLTELADNDDYCDLQSEITIELNPGEYQVCVAGYGINHGDYQLDITLPPPCDIQCPPESVAEGEVDCFDGYFDVFNGGCNSSPPMFDTIDPEEIICGTSGTFLFEGVSHRDSDWFQFTLAESSRVSFDGETEFSASFMVLDADNCDSLEVLDQITSGPCQTYSTSLILPPGVFCAFMAPTDFYGVECGAEYYLQFDVGEINNGETIEFALPLEPGVCVSNNTSGYLNDYDEVCPYTGSTSPDVVYTFQMDYVADVLFDMCESGYDTKLYVYNSALELIGCSDDDCENSQGDSYRSFIETIDLAADRYYVVCDGWGGASGDFELCVTITNPHSIETQPLELPPTVVLLPNHPNPFNPVTTISYELSVPARVEMAVFNINGERVVTLVEGLQTVGLHTVQFDGGGLPSGIYFYTLNSGDYNQTRRMLLVK